jgi:chorismate mutase
MSKTALKNSSTISSTIIYSIAKELDNLKDTQPKDLDMNILRSLIDFIDSNLVELLVFRMECSKLVGAFKKSKNLAIVDKSREKVLLQKIEQMAEGRLSLEFINAVYEIILDESKNLQK